MNFKIDDLSPEERIHTIFQAQNNPTRDIVTRLVFLLQNDPSPIVRHEAAYVLGEIEDEKSSEALLRAIFEDDNHFVVHKAALAIGNRGKSSNEEALKKLLVHENLDVALTAEIALERLRMKLSSISIQKPEAKQILLDLDTHPEHRIQSSFLLMEEGSQNSIDALVKALKQETNPIVKHEIIFALGETASKYTSDQLLAEIHNDANDFVVHHLY